MRGNKQSAGITPSEKLMKKVILRIAMALGDATKLSELNPLPDDVGLRLMRLSMDICEVNKSALDILRDYFPGYENLDEE